jgi:hypothetical protein
MICPVYFSKYDHSKRSQSLLDLHGIYHYEKGNALKQNDFDIRSQWNFILIFILYEKKYNFFPFQPCSSCSQTLFWRMKNFIMLISLRFAYSWSYRTQEEQFSDRNQKCSIIIELFTQTTVSKSRFCLLHKQKLNCLEQRWLS